MGSFINRRAFLQSALAGSFSVWVGRRAWSQGNKSPNEQLSFACIGNGGKGDSDTFDANTHGNLVASCDVDSETLSKAAAKYPKAKTFRDWRKMLDEMHNVI